MPDAWGARGYCPTYKEFDASDLQKNQWGPIGYPTPFTACFPCPGEDDETTCTDATSKALTASNVPLDEFPAWWDQDTNLEMAVKICEQFCKANREGESCRDGLEYWDASFEECTPGELFCDAHDMGSEGICRSRPTNRDECADEATAGTVQGQRSCWDHRLTCHDVGDTKVWVGEDEIPAQGISQANFRSNEMSASGPLHDCSNLVTNEESTCRGAEGKICLVFLTKFAIPWQVSNKAENSGCVGVLVFLNEDYTVQLGLDHSYDELNIPFVYILKQDGMNLLENKIGSIVKVEGLLMGVACWPNSYIHCSADWHCGESTYCFFNSNPTGDGDSYKEGYCEACPVDPLSGDPDPLACFFDSGEDLGSSTFDRSRHKTVQRVQSCASSCNAQLTSQDCKFCASDVTAFEFGVDIEEDQCILCPDYDLNYPDRVVPLFGSNIKCWQLESFFQLLPVQKNSQNCQLAQSMNYICGCNGVGYTGANTQTKQAALAWMPRVSAVLSIMGSTFIIFDILRRRSRGLELYQQILICMSIFDIIGSTAYGFTTLPTPEEDYLYGSRGNDASCTAQGFFIQLGTIAGYFNVSLAVYYFLAITRGMTEARIRAYQMWFFICPLALGMTFAFVGLPYYGNVFLWCNNTATWWPETPIALAIFIATIIMGIVCQDVHNKVQLVKRARREGLEADVGTLSTRVFWQSFWYLMGFYMTWVPYLGLQFLWSSGKAFTNYNFILYAATVIPLQGVWNWFNYARTRQLRHARELFSSMISSIGASFGWQQSDADRFTVQETRLTTIGAATTTIAPPLTSEEAMEHRSLLEDDDERLFSYFNDAYAPSDFVQDPDYWVADNESIPVIPRFYPILESSVFIPNGSGRMISEQIKKVLRSRSIVAVYDSRYAKADCTTKDIVSFRIRLYRKIDAIVETVVVEVQRRSGWDVKFQEDVSAIFAAAEGNSPPRPTEPPIYYQDDDSDYDQHYSGHFLECIIGDLCPENGQEVTHEGREWALAGLVSMTSEEKVGRGAFLISKDVLGSERFAGVRDAISTYACSSSNDPHSLGHHRAKLQSLEILANMTSSLLRHSETDNLSVSQPVLLHLISLVENAPLDPFAADLSCQILMSVLTSQNLGDEEYMMLVYALNNAITYGNAAFVDLEKHSQQCMILLRTGTA